MYTNISDTELLESWRARRDADAFAELVARYGPLVYSTCLRVLRSTHAAEDAAQDCFIDLVRTTTLVRSLPAFLHTAATRRALDRLRSEKRRGDREARFVVEEPGVTEATWDEVSRFVDEAIAELPENQRRPIVLRFFQGRTYAEIAAETGVAPSTVQHHLNRGIEGIRRHLKRHGITTSAGALAAMLPAAPSQALPCGVAAKLGTMALAGGNTAAGTAVISAAGLTTSAFFSKPTLVAALALIAGLLTAVPLVLLPPEIPANSEPGLETSVPVPAEPEPPKNAAANPPEAVATPLALGDTPPTDTVIEGMVVTRGGRPTSGAVANATWPDGPKTAESDAGGRFSIALPSGEATEVMLSATMGGYAVFPAAYAIPPTGLRDIELVLEPASAIAGKVIDREGNPLPGWRLVADRGDFSANTLTGEDGTFHLTSLRPGDYTIYAQSQDRRQAWHNGGMPYTLSGGLTETNLTLLWPPTSVSLTGTVTNTSGEPIADVELRSSYTLTTSGEQQFLRTKTDAEGRYALAGFPEWPEFEARVDVAKADYIQDRRYDIALDGHEEDFILLRRPTIKGHVLDAVTAEPVTRFRLEHTVGLEAGPGSSDLDWMIGASRSQLEQHPDGAFALLARGFNTLRIAVAAPGYVSRMKTLDGIAAESTLEGVQILLQPAPPITGIVVDNAHAPIAGARIFLGFPLFLNNPFLSVGNDGVTKTDEEGRFSVDEYPDGLVIVSAQHEGFAVGWTRISNQGSLRIVMPRPATIEGNVAWGGEPVGTGMAQIGVGLLDAASVASDETDEHGTYRTENVPPGRVWISANYREDSLRRSLGRELDVIEGQTLHANFDFDANGNATIEGVLLLDDEPVPLALLRAKATLSNGDSITYGTETRSDGSFTLGPIPTGEYEFGPTWIMQHDGSYLAPEPEVLTVREGGITTHDLLYSSR